MAFQSEERLFRIVNEEIVNGIPSKSVTARFSLLERTPSSAESCGESNYMKITIDESLMSSANIYKHLKTVRSFNGDAVSITPTSAKSNPLESISRMPT